MQAQLDNEALDNIEGLRDNSGAQDVPEDPDERSVPQPFELLYEHMKDVKNMQLRKAQRQEPLDNSQMMQSLRTWWQDGKTGSPPNSPWTQLEYWYRTDNGTAEAIKVYLTGQGKEQWRQRYAQEGRTFYVKGIEDELGSQVVYTVEEAISFKIMGWCSRT